MTFDPSQRHAAPAPRTAAALALSSPMPAPTSDLSAAARESIAAAARRFAADDRLVAATLARREWRLARGGRSCERCEEEKPLAAFSRDSRNVDGLRTYCRACAALADRARREARRNPGPLLL